MERLLCCLLGFPEKDAQVLRSLTRLFRPSLSADWAFEVGVTEDCDLLVCDLDDAGGRHAWNSPAPPGLLRAAASANDVDAGALLLRKPLRGHGPAGIVQVLNAAAAIKRPDIAPAPPPSASPKAGDGVSAPVEAAPSAFFKPEPAPKPAPPPAAETAPPPPAEAEAEAEAPAEAAAYAGDTADAAAAPRAPEAAAEAAVATRPEPAPEPAPPPAWASPAAGPLQAEPAQDEADIKDILRRMRFATIGTATEAPTALAALRELRGSERTAAVLEAAGMSSICVLPQARAWLCVDKAAEVYASLAESNRQVRVLPFSSTEEARDAAGCKDEPVRPLEQLMWLACLRTPPERLDTFESALFRLKRWPDLGNLPHEPHHMQWCGILTRQQAGLAALASNGGVSPAQTAAFLDACGELGILERTNATAAQVAAVQLPALSKKGRERISLFKNILGRLRIFRS